MPLLINIRYIKDGEEDKNFLGISLEERNKLDNMIKLCYKSDNNIEVNIFSGSIKREMIHSIRLRTCCIAKKTPETITFRNLNNLIY